MAPATKTSFNCLVITLALLLLSTSHATTGDTATPRRGLRKRQQQQQRHLNRVQEDSRNVFGLIRDFWSGFLGGGRGEEEDEHVGFDRNEDLTDVEPIFPEEEAAFPPLLGGGSTSESLTETSYMPLPFVPAPETLEATPVPTTTSTGASTASGSLFSSTAPTAGETYDGTLSSAPKSTISPTQESSFSSTLDPTLVSTLESTLVTTLEESALASTTAPTGESTASESLATSSARTMSPTEMGTYVATLSPTDGGTDESTPVPTEESTATESLDSSSSASPTAWETYDATLSPSPTAAPTTSFANANTKLPFYLFPTKAPIEQFFFPTKAPARPPSSPSASNVPRSTLAPSQSPSMVATAKAKENKWSVGSDYNEIISFSEDETKKKNP